MAWATQDVDCILRYRSGSLVAQSGYTMQRLANVRLLPNYAVVAQNFWRIHLQDLTSISWELESIRVSSETDHFELVTRLAGTAGDVGTVTNSCVLAAKIPTIGHQGRLYLPGLTEGSVNVDGSLNVNSRQSWQQGLDDWLEAHANADRAVAIRRPDGLINAINRMVVKPYCGRQDRRLQRSRR